MGADRATHSTGQARRGQAHCEHPRDRERDLLRALDGLPVESIAEGSSTQEHGALVPDALELGRNAGTDPSCSLCRCSGAGRTQAKSYRCHHRQPERQSGAKRGASIDPQGYDAGKKVTGRKRHILVDTLGLLLSVAVHPANIQDRDGVALVLDEKTRALWPFIVKIFADAGYRGARAALAAARTGSWIIEIVKRTELHQFVVLP